MTVQEKIANNEYTPEIKFSRDTRKEYNEQERLLMKQFKADLLSEIGFDNVEGNNALFNMAWENGHSCGLLNVVFEAEQLADLVRSFGLLMHPAMG